MSTSSTPDVLVVGEPVVARPAFRDDVPPWLIRRPGRFRRAAGWLVGWAWRIGAGAALCMTLVTSVAVFGWMYRRMQALVLYGWWKQSRFRRDGSFRDFCDGLGPDVQPQVGLAGLGIRSVADEAPAGQDRPDVAGEIDRIGRPRRPGGECELEEQETHDGALADGGRAGRGTARRG